MAFDLTESVSEEARAIGAINCLRPTTGGWEGHNTDAAGWLDSWNQEIALPLQGRKAIVLGAGGACRAILHCLRQSQVNSLVLLARNPTRAQHLLMPGEELAPWDSAVLAGHLEPGCLVIQTTPIGMHPQEQEIPLPWPSTLPPELAACDLIYNPSPTRWLQEARQRGARTLDGCGMLLHQAARAVEWWTGHLPPIAPMREALRQSLLR